MSFTSFFQGVLIAISFIGIPIRAHAFTPYCVSGIVRDSLTRKPIVSAEIRTVNKNADEQQAFAITDSNGYFKVCISTDIQSLALTHAYYMDISIQASALTGADLQMQDIFMAANQTVLTGVGVKAKRDKEKIEVDKKTYSVSGSVLSTGGTAVDALRQIPAVNVDADGNISLRGSNNVTIYINGKQSSLSGADRLSMLMQIPTANIESIDVNTNPGAKQDAEGMSGIINITLKQNTAKGKNGYLSLGAGDRNKYNGTGNFNYNNSVWNFSNTLSFRQMDLWGKGYSERHNFTPDTAFDINQYNRSRNLIRNMTSSGTIDYNRSKDLVFSLNYLLSENRDREDETNLIKLFNENDSLGQILRRQTLQNVRTRNTDVGLTVRKTFGKPAHNLVAMLNYSGTRRMNLTDIRQDELGTLNEEIISPRPYLLYNNNLNFFSNTLLQVDYAKPIHTDKKFETGLKFTGRNLDNSYAVDSFSYVAQQHIPDSGKSNHFIYSENVSAAYGMLSHTVNELFKYTVGLRVENTSIFGGEVYTQKSFVRNYTNLFPSGSINFTLQKKYGIPDLQMSYSRRISRPGQGQLNPFISITDPYNVSKGNPLLRPELTDAVELSAFYNTKPLLLTATVYYRQTNMPISRYRIVDSNGISITSFYNLNYNRSTGAELLARFSLFRNMKMTLNGNVYKFVTTGQVEGNDFLTQKLTYSGKAIMNYTFWNKTEFQASYAYMGPMATPQGNMRSMYGLEAGVKKDIVRERLSFSLTFSDVFNNRRFAMDLVDPVFTGNLYRKRESRIIMCNLTWKFGNVSTAEKKPKMQEPVNMDF